MSHLRCEDAPCCGHNDSICGQVLGGGPLEDFASSDSYYCDICGWDHSGPCPDYDEEDAEDESLAVD